MLVTRLLNEVCPQYGINNPDIFHEFIANVLEECGEFSTFSENLNYRVEALIALFGRHRISVADAQKYGRILGKQNANQQAIANIVYGGQWGKINLGNTQPNDGWDMRGSGIMQLTGRANIGQFATYYNKRFNAQVSVSTMADMLRNNLKIGIHGACWFFAIAKGLIDEAVNDHMEVIIKRINGGVNGRAKRFAYYEKAKKYFT